MLVSNQVRDPAKIDRLARLLAINKGTPGASVAILAPLGPEAIVSILASQRAGLAVLIVFFLAGAWLLAGVKVTRKS